MAALIDRVESLSGTVADHTDADIWLNDGVMDVIRRIQRMNPTMLHQFATSTAVTSSGLALTGTDIVVGVNRGSFPAREIPAFDRYKALLSTSLFYATARNPVFYRLNGTLYIAPAPGATSSAADVVIPPTITHDTTTVLKFAPEMVYLVTVYAAMQNTVARMTTVATSTTVPTVPTAAVLTDISITLPTAPTYTKPTESLFATGYTVITTHNDTNEDVELANTKINQVDLTLKKWQTDIQDEMNEFQKEKAIFDGTISKLIEEARLKTQQEMSEAELLIRRYASQVEGYVAEISSKVPAFKTQYETLYVQYKDGFAIYAPTGQVRVTR